MPDVIVSAGGFVSVPLVWAAWWCNIPVLVHHQDIRLSLAIGDETICQRVTQTEIGNPVRSSSLPIHHVDSTSTVLVMGGAPALSDPTT